MKPVAAGDELAGDLAPRAVLHIGHRRAAAVDIADRDHLGLVARRDAVLRERVHQVAGHLRLPVDRHRFSAGQVGEVDAMPASLEGELDPVVDKTLAMHALGDLGFLEQRDSAHFEHAGADAAEHIVLAPALEHDVGDAVQMQEPREQESRGTGADDGDLCVQDAVSATALFWPFMSLTGSTIPALV